MYSLFCFYNFLVIFCTTCQYIRILNSVFSLYSSLSYIWFTVAITEFCSFVYTKMHTVGVPAISNAAYNFAISNVFFVRLHK